MFSCDHCVWCLRRAGSASRRSGMPPAPSATASIADRFEVGRSRCSHCHAGNEIACACHRALQRMFVHCRYCKAGWRLPRLRLKLCSGARTQPPSSALNRMERPAWTYSIVSSVFTAFARLCRSHGLAMTARASACSFTFVKRTAARPQVRLQKTRVITSRFVMWHSVPEPFEHVLAPWKSCKLPEANNCNGQTQTWRCVAYTIHLSLFCCAVSELSCVAYTSVCFCEARGERTPRPSRCFVRVRA